LIGLGDEQHTLTSGAPNPINRPLPPVPRIPEEDECPVCHRELPSRDLPNFEDLRSRHVSQCIEDQIAAHSGRPRHPPSYNSSEQGSRSQSRATAASAPPQAPSIIDSSSQQSTASSVSTGADTMSLAQAINMAPSAMPTPSQFADTPEGRMAFREAQHAAVVLGHQRNRSTSAASSAAGPSHASPSAPGWPEPRRTGMFPYKATEKDCVDDAECTICLEEFEVGDDMARLECLCRFHRKCIRNWWENKPGRCPVHGHDGWGL
jgi:hypothetical protein